MGAVDVRVAWGWQPDPFGIYEERYISVDGEPTKLVRDHGTECYDPPPASPPPGD